MKMGGSDQAARVTLGYKRRQTTLSVTDGSLGSADDGEHGTQCEPAL